MIDLARISGKKPMLGDRLVSFLYNKVGSQSLKLAAKFMSLRLTIKQSMMLSMVKYDAKL